MLKNIKIREIICGRPVIIINNGKIQQDSLKYLRLSVEDLFEQLRQLDVFSINDVAFAIMETNGQMSVLKKSNKQPPDCATLGVSVPQAIIETVIVSDGNIRDFSLSLCGLSRDWLKNTLSKQNINIKEIFIMTANKNQEYNIIKKGD